MTATIELIQSTQTGERAIITCDGDTVAAIQWLDRKSADAYESGEVALADNHIADHVLDEPVSRESLGPIRVLRTA